jgi:UDP-N-acetylglucosamine 2-epimerase (non-hydrolysing)
MSIRKILTVFGTRPEVIKLAPVIAQLEACPDAFTTVNVSSGQHRELLDPFVRLFDLRVDHDLAVMTEHQTPSRVCSRVLAALDVLLAEELPDLILVQGDTTTALAAALAGFHRRIPIGHVEAGLRSGNAASPFPEEMNRRLITRVASYHFAATAANRDMLLAEGVDARDVFVTGNPVVDALHEMLRRSTPAPETRTVLAATDGLKRIVLTTHRRESFGEVMADNLRALRHFVTAHDDAAVIFPVHPNPAVSGLAATILGGHPRIHLIPPLRYDDFVVLLSHAWLIVSDSGGVQEEAPTLRKRLLVLRENTERPEVVDCGIARLVGGRPERLAVMLEESYRDHGWSRPLDAVRNPFGDGDSGRRIARILGDVLGASASPVSASWPERVVG